MWGEGVKTRPFFMAFGDSLWPRPVLFVVYAGVAGVRLGHLIAFSARGWSEGVCEYTQ